MQTGVIIIVTLIITTDPTACTFMIKLARHNYCVQIGFVPCGVTDELL